MPSSIRGIADADLESWLHGLKDDNGLSLHKRKAGDPSRAQAEIGLAVGAVINSHKLTKHFAVTITNDSFSYGRKPDSVVREAARWPLCACPGREAMSTEDTVRAYKNLARVEQAFRR